MKNLKKSSVLSLILALCMMLSLLVSCLPESEFDVSPSPEPTPPPTHTPVNEDGVRTEPSFILLTEIPSGTVTGLRMDIEYEALPSDGAYITKIDYTINGERIGNALPLYLPETPGISELGTGSIRFRSGENNIVIFVEDSAGKSAEFVMESTPYLYEGFSPPPWDWDKMLKLEDREGNVYLQINRLRIKTHEDVSFEEVEQAIKAIDGIIIGWDAIFNNYTIKVSDSTEQELEAMCELLLTLDIIKLALPDRDSFSASLNLANTNGSLNGTHWGLDAIKAPEAWESLDEHGRKDNIKVAVVDDDFASGHGAYVRDIISAVDKDGDSPFEIE